MLGVGLEFVVLGSCPHHNQDLKGRDAVVKQNGSFICIHSKRGGG